LSYEVFDGNRADVTTLEQMLEQVESNTAKPVASGSLIEGL